jgi:hypothetical protein
MEERLSSTPQGNSRAANELKTAKELESFAAMTDRVLRIDEELKRRFESSREGREAAYLNDEVIGKLLKDRETLLKDFLPKVADIVRSLDSFGDAKLGKMFSDVEKRIKDISSVDEIAYFRKIKEQVETGKFSAAEVNHFIAELDSFKRYLVEHHPKSEVLAKMEKARYLVHIRNYLAEILEWKEVLFRMSTLEQLTDPSDPSAKVISADELSGFKAKKVPTADSVWNVEGQLDELVKVLEKKAKEISVRYGDPEYAKIFLSQVSKGSVDRFAVLRFIEKLSSPESMKEAEDHARIELHGIVKAHLEHIDRLVEKEREVLVKLSKDRVKEIEHEHAKDLEKIERIKEHRTQEAQDIMTARLAEDNVASDLKGLVEHYLKLSAYILHVVDSNFKLVESLHTLDEEAKNGRLSGAEYHARRQELLDYWKDHLVPALENTVSARKQQVSIYNKIDEEGRRIDAIHTAHEHAIDKAADEAAKEQKEVDDIEKREHLESVGERGV